MILSIQIKFKFHQYQMSAVSPKLPAIRYIIIIINGDPRSLYTKYV